MQTPRAPYIVAHASSRRGFALLITITLVAFLVLILVSLATLTRVETQVATNMQTQNQARQNALAALNIALGELQKYTGPDQRTTARSDMDKDLANTTTASGRWLGAYGNRVEADYTQLPSVVASNIVSTSTASGGQSALLNWLVSGNEKTAFTPSTNVGSKGDITAAPSSFAFSPSGAVAGLSSSVTGLSDTLTVADSSNTARPARLMVGPKTVGDSVSDYVVAPLRELQAAAPGLGTAPVPVGRYAWWVGDENAKARVNLPMAGDDQAANAFVTSQRAAVELMDAANPSANTVITSAQMLDPNGSLNRYDPTSDDLKKVLCSGQLPMLSPSGSSTLAKLAKYRYHDISAWSSSVLADNYAGGLKKDLSALLAKSSTAFASPFSDNDFIFPPDTVVGGGRPYFGMPTWGLVRNFVQTTSSSSGLTPTPPTMVKIGAYTTPIPTSQGVGPVLSYAYIGLSYGLPTSAPSEVDGAAIKLAISPIVVLWNPYNCDLKPAQYEIGFRKNTRGQFELQARNDDDTSAWSLNHVLHVGNLDNFSGTNDKFVRFIIDNSKGIPAGQSLVFTLGQNGLSYSAGDTANPLVNEYHPGYHVVVNTGVTIGMTMPNDPTKTLKVGATYRVGVKGGAGWNTSQYSIPRTFFTNTNVNYGGSDYHEVYLGDIGATTPPGATNTNYPYTSSNASRRWYQSVMMLLPPYTTAPYGTNHGYSTNKDNNGLFREEGPISVISQPTFRLGFFMGFKTGRDRWLAQGNPRALMAFAGNFIRAPIDSGSWPTSLNVMLVGVSPQANAGIDLKYSGTAPVNAQLFEFRPEDQPFLTIGQLQHANLTWNGGPSYAVGNSLLPNSFNSIPEQIVTASGNASYETPANLVTAYHDISWLVNRALWDRFFVSTVPNKGTGVSTDTDTTAIPAALPNALMHRVEGASITDLRDANRAATALTLTGGFNINSTSEQAWRAVLGGINQLKYDPVNRIAISGKRKVVLSRFSHPTSSSPTAVNAETAWSSYRELDDIQIAQLAKNIVSEIRSRGPFVSLADFINRRLYDTGVFAQPNDKRLKGTIQAAIDATTTGPEAVNNESTAPFDAATLPLVTDNYANGTIITNPAKTGQASGGPASAVRVAPYSSPSAFAPQFLTQGDVLSAIGANLSGRSDTFTIRAYGETLNPLASTTEITGRAWCEAVVQRQIDYVDTNANPDPTATPSAGGTNANLGRRYKIISFKWLSPDEI